ncbi:hypothetical protein PHYPSEUDO_001028 [Phytophthora pseudosyringae]|uniref:Uncharacterized protein n=1 Tax=Phytophthora pseudosyringae TaxID=221518 RepID=A0A8T1V3G0_9STRA|nr:hypothetical protein PHYPSEUDO_001028 [Phytophthora pseudosyringae]
MQDFSEWMTALQQRSPASSYAETDVSDSDSDRASCDDCQCRLEAKRTSVAKDAHRTVTRTAPISIPSSGRRQLPHPHLCASVADSPDLSYHADTRLLRSGRYLHEDDEDSQDEDDPAFYGNLAFFRSQYGASQTRMVKRRSHPLKSSSAGPPASPTGVDGRDDDDIFAMELGGRHRCHAMTSREPTSNLHATSVGLESKQALPSSSSHVRGASLQFSCSCRPRKAILVRVPDLWYRTRIWKEIRLTKASLAQRPRSPSPPSPSRVRQPGLGTRLGLGGLCSREACAPVTTERLGRARGGDSANHAANLRFLFWANVRAETAPATIAGPIAEPAPGACSRRRQLGARRPALSLAQGAHCNRAGATCNGCGGLTPDPSMSPAQTQSLPAWASIKALPSVAKPGAAVDDEDPLYLSGEETDCDSERGSDTLSREDQQLMASFIRLQRERACKQASHRQAAAHPAVARTTPVLIPVQTRQYVATSTKRWIWDEDDEESDEIDQCPCCHHQSVECRPAASAEPAAEATDASAVSDLLFDLEL